MYDQFSTPAVVVDLDIVENNIRRMAERNRAYGIAHRPHIKAHKSIFLAKKQLELGCVGITCAKISEALVMAKGGIQNILIAFPIIGDDKLEMLEELLGITDQVCTIVNSQVGAQGLSKLGEKLGKPISVLIEVDGGIDRGGIKPGQPTLDFARSIRDLHGIAIQGLLYYGGNIYRSKTDEEIIAYVQQGQKEIADTAALLSDDGLDMHILSAGSSYSARFPQYLKGITEVRAGNYIFGDNTQLCCGFITEQDCALRVVGTVVCRPSDTTAILDTGSKSLTTDTGAYTKGYGHIIGYPEAEIYKLNEEHGFVRSVQSLPWEIGQKVAIIPNHACVICNLNDEVYGVRGEQLERMISIDARGKSV